MFCSDEELPERITLLSWINILSKIGYLLHPIGCKGFEPLYVYVYLTPKLQLSIIKYFIHKCSIKNHTKGIIELMSKPVLILSGYRILLIWILFTREWQAYLLMLTQHSYLKINDMYVLYFLFRLWTYNYRRQRGAQCRITLEGA